MSATEASGFCHAAWFGGNAASSVGDAIARGALRCSDASTETGNYCCQNQERLKPDK